MRSITLVLFVASTAIAQTPTVSQKPFAVIEGIAVDSLHQDVLRGALLTVEGTSAAAMTDSLGKFRIDSIPPGTHRGADFECVSYVVDGDPWIGGGIEDFIRSDDIAAIEVYSNSFVPAQFRRPTQDCETVVIWTKWKQR